MGGWGLIPRQQRPGEVRLQWGSPEVSLQASFSSASFLPSFYNKGEGTVFLPLTNAPELHTPSWRSRGGEIGRYKIEVASQG